MKPFRQGGDRSCLCALHARRGGSKSLYSHHNLQLSLGFLVEECRRGTLLLGLCPFPSVFAAALWLIQVPEGNQAGGKLFPSAT